MLVRNAVGTSRFEAPKGYQSWLDYWKKHTNKNGSSDKCVVFIMHS